MVKLSSGSLDAQTPVTAFKNSARAAKKQAYI
jgi:hypothetical protein